MVITDILKTIQKIPNLNEIKGSIGEYITKYYLNATTDTLVLHDILIKGDEDMSSQIDLLIIARTGIYVVEVKRYDNAKIYGNGKRNTWYYYLGGKKYDIYSPLKQNKKHIENLKNFLTDFGNIPYFSVLTIICNDFKVDDINANPDNPDTFICNSLPAMSKGLKLLSKDKPEVLNDETRQKIFNYIQANQQIGKDARLAHKEKVKEIKKEINDVKKQNLCPYCKVPLVLRKGKYGEFYGCSNYPKCKFTKK